MSNRRLIRVAEVIRGEISRLASRERSLEGALITFTGVEVSPDLRHADVYVTSLNPQMSGEQLLANLERVRVSWQSQIGSKVKIKYTPRLSFHLDEAQQRGDRVMQILDSLPPLKEEK
jgi:ribosome-binding factor A